MQGLRLLRISIMALLLCISTVSAASSVWVLELRGAVGPASADYLIRGMAQAEQSKADLLVLQMDTPGGLDVAMRDIIKAIIASKVPIVTYVSPGGARAASAGTYIMYASHIAAMAPATNLGAATPVQITAPSFPSGPKPSQDKDDKQQNPMAKPGDAMERKLINDAVAYIQGLADLHGRNKTWAEQAVREAASLSAEEALAEKVIDIVAKDIADLISQLNQRRVNLNGEEHQLTIVNPEYTHYQPDWRNQFLTVITSPNVAYILMMLGIYGLILEAYNPGTLVPGIVGGVSLLIALYAFQVLPVSYAGLALIALGVMLMVAEAFAPSFGILGFGGIVAFIFGSVILMDTDIPAYQIALPIILSIAAVSAVILVIILSMILKARRQHVVSGLSTLEGVTTTVTSLHGEKPMVQLQGELWEVDCNTDLQTGDSVRIVAADGVVLKAEKQMESQS